MKVKEPCKHLLLSTYWYKMTKEQALLKDSVYKVYITYLVPTILGMLTNSVYCLVDVIFVGKYVGSEALAAFNIAMPIFTIYSAIGIMLGVGGATTISVLIGQREKEKTNKVFSMTILTCLIVGVIVTILGIVFLKQFAMLLGAPETMVSSVMEYIRPIHRVAFLFILNGCLQVIVRADYNPKLVMAAATIGNLCNILFDYIFVGKMGLGLEGAAQATALGPCVSVAILMLHYLCRKNTMHLKLKCFDVTLFGRMLANGLGTFILEFSSGVVIFMFNFVLLRVSGAGAVAVYAIASNIAYVGKGIFNGISQSAQPLISVNYGASNHFRIRKTLNISLYTTIIFSTVVYAVILLFPEQIISLFVSDGADLMKQAVDSIKIYFFSFVFTGVNTAFMYYFQSVENVKMTIFIALSRGFFLIILGLLIFPAILGENGVWLTISFAEIVTLLYVFLRKGRKAKKLEKHPEYKNA